MIYDPFRHGTADFPVGIHDTRYDDGFRLYPHIHRELEFLVLKEGRGIMYVEDEPYEIKAGDGIFINSRALHQGVRVDIEISDFYAIVFAPEVFGNLENDLVMNRYVLPVIDESFCLPTLYKREVDWQAEILAIADDIHRAYHEALPGWEIGLKANLFRLWQLCFAHGQSTDRSGHSRRTDEIKLALEYIRDEYASPLTLEDMAARAGMSRGHFCRVFSSVMRMSPFDYLQRVRVDNGCNFLRETDLSVGEISQRCGFNSFSYFSKRFKEIMDCTPAEYKSRYRSSKTGP